MRTMELLTVLLLVVVGFAGCDKSPNFIAPTPNGPEEPVVKTCENEEAWFADGHAYVKVISKVPTCGGTVDAGTIPKLEFEYWQDIFEKGQFSVIPLEADGVTPVVGAVTGDQDLAQPWWALGYVVQRGETIRKKSGSDRGISSRVDEIHYLGVYFGDNAGGGPFWKGPITCPPETNQRCNAGQMTVLLKWKVRR